jgi:hypothetical protein
VVIPAGSAQAPQQEHEIVMLLNFADELRRRVPASSASRGDLVGEPDHSCLVAQCLSMGGRTAGFGMI